MEIYTAKRDEEFSLHKEKPVKLSKKEKQSLKEEKKKLKNKKLDVDKVSQSKEYKMNSGVFNSDLCFRITMKRRPHRAASRCRQAAAAVVPWRR